jgi:outer membrane biosynthesis protein TonB
MDYAADPRTDRPASLLPPFALSILAHLLLALLFVAASLHAPQPASAPFQVELLQPEEAARARAQARSHHAQPAPAQPEKPVPVPKTQIVSPPDSPKDTPDKAHLLSDRDSRAVEEMIKRGEPAPPAKPPTSKPDNAKQAATDQPATKARGDASGTEHATALAKADTQSRASTANTAPPVGLSDLFVRPSELARDPALAKGDSGESDKTAEGGKRDLASLPRPDLWADPGPRGSPDYLPNVRQGDITLLNTKADRFAPFVRRVGLRVFQSFTMEFKQEIHAGTVPEGRENVEIEAVMTRDGKRADVFLRQHDGNLSADRTLLGTLTDQIFFDENPPTEAVAADGRIHFIFALDAQVFYQGGGRRGGGGRQPGAQWVMGAGLL